jgi:hypothetical protein
MPARRSIYVSLGDLLGPRMLVKGLALAVPSRSVDPMCSRQEIERYWLDFRLKLGGSALAKGRWAS